MRLASQYGEEPNQEVRLNLPTVQFIEHFVPSTLVRIVGDIAHASLAVTLDKGANAFHLLSNRVIAARNKFPGSICSTSSATPHRILKVRTWSQIASSKQGSRPE